MKITDVKAHLVSVPLVDEAGAEASFGIKRGTTRIIIEIETDEGITGLGEAWPYTLEDYNVLMQRYKPRLLGRLSLIHI